MKAAGLIVILVLALGGCARAGSEQPQRCFEIDAGAPVDPLLLAFLSRARAAHHLADDLESQGDLAGATAALGGLVTGPLPHENQALAPEVREVLADTRARLADLRSRQGAFEAALADARAGLELVPEASYFRGHLLETEGLVEERHAKAVAKSDPVASETLRKRAIGLLEQAMAVQSEVIQRASSKPGSSGGRPEFPATSPPPTPAPSSSAAPPQ